MNYRLLIALEVVEFLERLPARQRRPLRRAIEDIRSDPRGCSDAAETDEIGRPVQIYITGDYALVYWIDDADRHVKVLDLHAADR
jgi:mRNA-degrading endonuclease RelE of RelBE toxin-antitoxin system